MFKNVEDLVLEILKKHPETRNNDKLLVIKVWKYQGLKLTEQQINFLLNKFTYNSESITRARRDIQSRGLYQPDLDSQKQRSLFQESMERKYSVSL